MEVAFALVLPLVAGYLYVSGCNPLRYKQARDDGHRLYFRIAYYGLLLFVATGLILGLVYWSLDEDHWIHEVCAEAVRYAKPLLKESEAAPAQLSFLFVCVATVGLGRCLPLLENWLFQRWKFRFVLEAAALDDLELFLLEAAVEYKSISVTTSSSKVYVGLVLQTGEPKMNRRVVTLLPFMSGYRTEAGKVIFTTFYDEVYPQRDGNAESLSIAEDFRLVLPIDKMVSVSFFDPKVYAAFNAKPPLSKPRRLATKALHR